MVAASESRSVASRTPAEHAQKQRQHRRSAPYEQVGVVEVHVDETGERTAHERTTQVSERVCGGYRGEAPSGSQPNGRRRRERSPWLARGQIRRTGRTRCAVDVTELCTRIRDILVRVPAATAEERRRDTELAEASSFDAHALAGSCSGGSGVVGGRPVRVVPERSQLGSLTSSLEPERIVLPRLPHRPGA